MKTLALGLALFCVMLSSAAQIALKRGMNTPEGSGFSSTYAHAMSSPMVWLGITLYGLSTLLWLWVLSRLDVSLAYPLVSLGFVLTMSVGVFWLNEPFSWTRVVACGFIVMGVCLLALDV